LANCLPWCVLPLDFIFDVIASLMAIFALLTHCRRRVDRGWDIVRPDAPRFIIQALWIIKSKMGQSLYESMTCLVVHYPDPLFCIPET
jgi:hypothetical protein